MGSASVLAANALAQSGALTETLHRFIGLFHAGAGHLAPSVQRLLWILAGIEIVLTGLWWALGGGEQLAAVFKKLLFLTFWCWLVTNFVTAPNGGTPLAKTFVDSLIGAGLIAGGAPAGDQSLLLDPSQIAEMGLDAITPLALAMGNITLWDLHLSTLLVFGLSFIFIIAIFFVMAIEVFMAVLEFYLLTAVVGILMPFGIFKPTRFISEKALGAIVSSGIKLMVLAFLIAVVRPTLLDLSKSITPGANGDITNHQILCVVLTVAAIGLLVHKGPTLAAGLLSGSPSLTAATAGAAAGAAAGVATSSAARAMTAVHTATRVASGAYHGATGAAAGTNVRVGGGGTLVHRVASAAAVTATGGLRGASAALVKSAVGTTGRNFERQWDRGRRDAGVGTTNQQT